MRGQGTWIRGGVSLAVLAGLAAALIASPVGAFDPGDKKKVKKIARKEAATVADALSINNDLVYVRSNPVALGMGEVGLAAALCPAGYHVTGGGVGTTFTNLNVEASYPSNGVLGSAGHEAGDTAWAVVVESDQVNTVMRAYAVCAKVDTVTANYAAGSTPSRGDDED